MSIRNVSAASEFILTKAVGLLSPGAFLSDAVQQTRTGAAGLVGASQRAFIGQSNAAGVTANSINQRIRPNFESTRVIL